MAIKGKGKPRRRRTTAPPRPIYVQAKKPLLRRRGVQVGILLVVLAGIGVIAWVALAAKADRDREAARQAAREERLQVERDILARFGGRVRQAMAPVSQEFQTTLIPFPDLDRDLDRLKSGDLEAEEAIELADSNVQLATTAERSIDGFNVAQEINGHPDLIGMATAQRDLVGSIGLFQEVARTFKLAAQQEDEEVRDAILERAGALWDLGAQQFQQGWQGFVNLLTQYGLPPPQAPPPEPTPTPTPSASVSPSPTETPSASPSPEPSGSDSPSPDPTKSPGDGNGEGSPSPSDSPSVSPT